MLDTEIPVGDEQLAGILECATCGKLIEGPDAFINGVGKVCRPCAHMHEVAQLRDRTKPYYAYLNGDGSRITDWPGGVLMYVVQERTIGHNWWHTDTLTYVLARDVHGAWWYGRGSGRGMCITMRPRKTVPAAWLVGKANALAQGKPGWERA